MTDILKQIDNDNQHFIFVLKTKDSSKLIKKIVNEYSWAILPVTFLSEKLSFDEMLKKISIKMIISPVLVIKVNDFSNLNPEIIKSLVHGEYFQYIDIALDKSVSRDKYKLLILTEADAENDELFTKNAALTHRTKFFL